MRQTTIEHFGARALQASHSRVTSETHRGSVIKVKGLMVLSYYNTMGYPFV